MAADEAQARGDRALPARGARRPGSAASSATRSTSAISPRPTTRSTRSRSRRCATPSTRRARSSADGVIFHVGSHLGAGFESGLDRTCAALAQVLERCEGDTWLLMENSAGAGGTIGRSLEELQTLLDRLDGHPRLGICLDSCHLYVSGYDVTDPHVVDALVRRARRADRGRPAAGAARERQRRRARLEPRPSREHRRRADGRGPRRISRPSRVPASERLPRGPRRRRAGPNADELQKLRDLHARWVSRKPVRDRVQPLAAYHHVR